MFVRELTLCLIRCIYSMPPWYCSCLTVLGPLLRSKISVCNGYLVRDFDKSWKRKKKKKGGGTDLGFKESLL